MTKLKAVFMGTPDFSVPILKTLNDNSHIEIIAVVTMPDRPAGRGQRLTPPPVAICSQELGLKLFQTENINREAEIFDYLKNEGIDFILVVAFAQFLGKKILDLPKLGCFNIHASLLPKYRGAAPIQYALLNGDSITGISIQRMVKKLDAGDIAFTHEVPISEHDTSELLFNKLRDEASIALANFLPLLIDKSLSFTQQDDSKATFAPTIKKEDGHLDFAILSGREVINKFRAYTPWPGTSFTVAGTRIKLAEVELMPNSSQTIPGQVQVSGGKLLAHTRSGTLWLKKIQLEGRKPCSDRDFINGIRDPHMAQALGVSL
jgi:methionyl-tRNA formyltransferase